LLGDRRIRILEAQKHTDPTDPDPQHWLTVRGRGYQHDNGPDKHKKEGENLKAAYPWVVSTLPIHITSVSYLMLVFFRSYPYHRIQKSSHDLGYILIWFWILLSNYNMLKILEKS
jgi:hypothetical protein